MCGEQQIAQGGCQDRAKGIADDRIYNTLNYNFIRIRPSLQAEREEM